MKFSWGLLDELLTLLPAILGSGGETLEGFDEGEVVSCCCITSTSVKICSFVLYIDFCGIFGEYYFLASSSTLF